MYRSHVLVCGGTECTSSGSQQILETLKGEIQKSGLTEEVTVVQIGCHGPCALDPVMIIYPDVTFYSMVQVSDVPEIVSEHLLKGRVVTRLLYQEVVTVGGGVKALSDTDSYKKQCRTALHNCGVINPEVIEEYIGTGGYVALGKVPTEMTSDDVIQTLLDSGLRGRSGGGFSTSLEWKLAKGNDADQKCACCNADEDNPGALMDRPVLESDPHALSGAMTITGYAIGASQGYIYVRAGYPVAVERLKIAISQAREMELLDSDIFGSDFSFDIDLRLGAGAFVCGEETTLMTSIEDNRGEPRPRPPLPAQKGLFGKPIILNNVGTYANIPQITLNGTEWFTFMGMEKSKGTKVFTLGGKIHNTELVEAPMGTTLREVIEEIGGGIPNSKKLKAAQTGGPSGGCIPVEHSDIPIDCDNLITTGSMTGSGGLIVLDEDDCMVDIAKFFPEFTVEESCGKCTLYRVGTKCMLGILDKITKGKATMEDLDKLEELCYYTKEDALCGLGQTAPNPVLSTLRFSRDEYEVHIRDKKCPAGACKALMSYNIDPDKYKGCALYVRNCPNNAIVGMVKNPHVINQGKCIKCGACMEKCKLGATYKK